MKLNEKGAAQSKLLKDLALNTWAERLESACARLDEGDCKVLLTGEFGRGKTSFLNALIGKELLYTSALPVTTTNVVRYGITPTARAMIDGTLQVVQVETLADQSYGLVELDYPLPICQNDVILQELPSMSEAPEEFTKVAIQADIVVMVMACDALFSATEREMAEKLKSIGHRRLFFVCNFVDRLPADQHEAIRQSAYTRLPANPEQIFFVSTEQALSGDKAANDAIKNIEQVLADSVANISKTKQDRVTWLLKETLKIAKDALREKQSAFSQRQSQAKDKVNQLQGAYQDTATAGHRIQADFEDFRQQTQKVLQAMVNSFIRDLAQKVEVWSRRHTGDDLSEYVTAQIRQETRIWQEQSLQPYIQQQVAQQEQAFQSGIAKFDQKLANLYKLAGEEEAVPNLQILLAKPDIDIISVETGKGNLSPAPVSQIDLIKMPETLLTLTASVAAILLIRPFILGLPLGVAGIGVAFWLGRSRLQNQDHNARVNAVQAYALAIRAQADKISLSVWEGVNEQLTVVQTGIDEMLSETLQHARQLVTSNQVENYLNESEQHKDLARRLEEIEHATKTDSLEAE